MHIERHRSDRIGWLRAAVLGANDGLISTSSLVVGVAAAAPDRAAILEIPAVRGDYPLPSGRLILRVIPVDILDGARKKVLKTIG